MCSSAHDSEKEIVKRNKLSRTSSCRHGGIKNAKTPCGSASDKKPTPSTDNAATKPPRSCASRTSVLQRNNVRKNSGYAN
jgi:hypothetical protein